MLTGPLKEGRSSTEVGAYPQADSIQDELPPDFSLLVSPSLCPPAVKDHRTGQATYITYHTAGHNQGHKHKEDDVGFLAQVLGGEGERERSLAFCTVQKRKQ